LIKTKVDQAEVPIIKAFPTIIIMKPIISAAPNLPECLRMSQKEAQAEEQKFLLWRAI